jgi:hypothetical protein
MQHLDFVFKSDRKVSSAFIYGPEALRLVPNLKQAVLGIVALAACRTSEIPAPASAPPIIGFVYNVYNKSCTAADGTINIRGRSLVSITGGFLMPERFPEGMAYFSQLELLRLVRHLSSHHGEQHLRDPDLRRFDFEQILRDHNEVG